MQHSNKPNKPNNPGEPAADEIRTVAYCIWSDTGRASGRELENWIAAREILRCLESGGDAPDADRDERRRDVGQPDGSVTMIGEVVDLACYLARGAHGPAHAACARRCIARGLPVGLRAEDGRTYLLTGDRRPVNKRLERYAARKIVVQGKLVTRDGIDLLKNVKVVKLQVERRPATAPCERVDLA